MGIGIERKGGRGRRRRSWQGRSEGRERECKVMEKSVKEEGWEQRGTERGKACTSNQLYSIVSRCHDIYDLTLCHILLYNVTICPGTGDRRYPFQRKC